MQNKHTHEDGTPFTKEEFLQKLKTDKEFNDEFGNKGIDQISELIEQLKDNPDSRRLLVSAWAVHDLPKMVLPPCHYGFQVYTRKLSTREMCELAGVDYDEVTKWTYHGKNIDRDLEVRTMLSDKDVKNIPTRTISLMWNQRSVDTGLGWGFNVASYGLLLMMLAKQVNMVPDELICSLGDCHIYSDHVDGLKEQIQRSSFPLPTVRISDRIVDDLADYTLEDFLLENYESHPSIKLPLSN